MYKNRVPRRIFAPRERREEKSGTSGVINDATNGVINGAIKLINLVMKRK